jgi:hypothetical protein
MTTEHLTANSKLLQRLNTSINEGEVALKGPFLRLTESQITWKRRTILLETGMRISTPLRRTQAVTQKTQCLFEKTTFSDNTMLFSHGLGHEWTSKTAKNLYSHTRKL